jgi:hypothetical protein
MQIRGNQVCFSPKEATQPVRYCCNPEQYDLWVQIRRLKRPLMEKVWQPKLWASTIASIWTYGRPNSGQGARRYGPRNASCAHKSEIRQIIFRGCFGILSSFSRKAMNTKVEDNSVAHNVGDMVPARKGCESGKSGRGWVYGNQVRFSPKEDLVQGKVEHSPRLPKGINTNPEAPKKGNDWDPFSREPSKEGDTPKEANGRRKSSRVSRRWLRQPLDAMDSLRGCAMVEFGSHPQHPLGYVHTCWWYQSTFYSSCLNFGLLQCMLSSSYVMHPYVRSKIRSICGD